MALLTLPDGRHILQRRDPEPTIFFPDHWGLFGGALDAGETPERALLRELDEELGLQVDAGRPAYFSRHSYDLRPLGGPQLQRWYFHIAITEQEWCSSILGEGRDVGAFDLRTAFRDLRLVPYDAFALWLHGSRGRLAFDPPPP